MASAPVISAALMMAGMFRYESTLRGGPMHTAWSAKRTWRLPASASEYTATVLIPISLHAHITRSAISPRLAIRILRKLTGSGPPSPTRGAAASIRADGEERLAVLDGLPALVVDLDDLPRDLRLDLVHQLHGLDDAEHLAHAHAVTHVHEGWRAGVGRAVEGAHDRALHRRQARLLLGGGGRGGRGGRGDRRRRQGNGDVEGRRRGG